MTKWYDLYTDTMTEARLKAELMLALWDYVLRCGDPSAVDTLTMPGNSYSVESACGLLDCRGLYPDSLVLEWASRRIAQGPPLTPFMVLR